MRRQTASVTQQFEKVANFVTERIAELLRTQVLVVDERGVAIAQSSCFPQQLVASNAIATTERHNCEFQISNSEWVCSRIIGLTGGIGHV